ncbi:MAG: methyltransferase domain-containing protein [Gammaproteobacteria bacterium]|nr:methyltransferase domain-containing protein [Gammaproteobacteria bacterium]
MSARSTADNRDQIAYWNDAAGATWAKLQIVLDRQVEPLGREAIRRLAPRPDERILDLGCGCGQTSLELAAEVGPSGAVVALDVSRPMLAVARARARPVPGAAIEFREADAQVEPFAPAVFDAAFSRFGVMFFADPVAAFGNVRRALKPAGRLAFVCWRTLEENDWMRVPLEAARGLLPPPTPVDPQAPGPFAFADAARVRRILVDAGFVNPRIEPFDALIGGTGLDETVRLLCRVGPLGAAMRERPDLLPAAADAVRAALSPRLGPDGVRMRAAVWIVQAASGP